MGRSAAQLLVAFRVSQGVSDVVVRVDEATDEVVVRVGAVWHGPNEASAGWFPYFTPATEVVELERPVGTRRTRAVPDTRHSPSVC